MLQALILLVVAVLVAIDLIIKSVVLKYLAPVGSYILVKNFLSLTYVENTGAAFGSFSGHTDLLSAFTAVVLLVGLIYVLSGKIKSKVVYLSLIMIISGGTGNLIDRVTRGFVVDYIEPLFVRFAVFNFADILVTVGAAILIIYLIYDIIKDSKKSETVKDNE